MNGSLFIFILIVGFGFQTEAFEASKHPIRSVSFWKGFQKIPFEKRILSEAPIELIDYLQKDNESQGWPQKPEKAIPAKSFKKDLKAAVEELPAAVKKALRQKLIGIFFVTNLGGSASSEFIVDEKGLPVAGTLTVDVEALDKKANEWATWKESSPFKSDPGIQLEAQIESTGKNSRKNAIQYILLHEFGHVLSIGNPEILLWGNKPYLEPGMTFSKISWENQDKGIRPVSSWDEPKSVPYYVGEARQFPATRIPELYRKLEKSNFPTLYATTNPYDDFAESFASYVHVVKMKKPWLIKITTPTETFVVKDCWQEKRCEEKRKFLERLLKSRF